MSENIKLSPPFEVAVPIEDELGILGYLIYPDLSDIGHPTAVAICCSVCDVRDAYGQDARCSGMVLYDNEARSKIAEMLISSDEGANFAMMEAQCMIDYQAE